MKDWCENYGLIAGLGLGIAVGTATHQLAAWIAIGAGIGLVLGEADAICFTKPASPKADGTAQDSK